MDLFDVAIASKNVSSMAHLEVYRNEAGSYIPLTMRLFINLPIGHVMHTVNDQNERVMVVITQFGNVVLHERNRADNFVIAVAPPSVQPLLGNGQLTDDQIAMVLGLWGKDNIGQVLANLTSNKQEKAA